MDDISGYKVADLKQALKERGLPVAGSKAELASRLTAALATEKSSDDSVIDESVLDEDLLAEDDDDEGDDEDVDENIVLEGNGLQDDNLVASVGIKRQASPSKTSLAGTTDIKKVKLNRDTVPTIPPPIGSASPTKTTITSITTENVSASDGDPSKATVKVAEVGAISAEERAKLRQQKFGGGGDATTPAAPVDDKRQARAARFGIASTPTPAATNKTAVAKSPEDLALLEKRKARFGIEPEIKPTKEQVDEAKQKRAARFGGGAAASALPSGASDEKLKSRAARFGT